MLTLNLMGCSTKSGKIRVESIVTISGELRQKGTDDSRRLKASLLDSLDMDDLRNKGNLLS
jgi:hypothetical protein